jgi:type IV pilus assembly protein PilV
MSKRGFTLIEVLVTLVILAFGLFGIAGLMARGQRASFEAFQRQQALAMANDMAERVRANPTQAVAYSLGATVNSPRGQGVMYNSLLTGAISPNCAVTSSCDTAQLAEYDLALWDGLLSGYTETQKLTGNLVGGIINARGCIEETANTIGLCPGAPAPAGTPPFTRSLRVSVSWQGNEDTVAPTTSNCGNGVYGFETRRRLVSIDVMVMQPCP